MIVDILAWSLIVTGAFFTFAAGLGLLRFPDLLSRIHSAAKPQTLGMTLILIGLALRLQQGRYLWMLLLVVAFQMMTAPVSAHMVARAGYRTGKTDPESLVVDELTRDLLLAKEVAERREREEQERAERERQDRERQERERQDRAGRAPDADPAG